MTSTSPSRIPDEAIDAALIKLTEAPLIREFMRATLEAAVPHKTVDPRIDAILVWAGRHRSGYYDEAQDDVVAILRGEA